MHPANLGQLLEDTTLFLVCEVLLELTLFVTQTLSVRRHPRWRHGEQNVGAIHPVDMQQFPLPLQTQCSLGQLLWPFVNLNAIIPPDLKDVMFS